MGFGGLSTEVAAYPGYGAGIAGYTAGIVAAPAVAAGNAIVGSYGSGVPHGGPLADDVPASGSVEHANAAITPAETPSVAAAKAAHFAAKGAVIATSGPGFVVAPGVGYAAGYGYGAGIAAAPAIAAGTSVAAAPAIAVGPSYTAPPAIAAGPGYGYSGYGYGGYAAGYGYGGYAGPLAGVLPLVVHPNGAVVPVDVNADFVPVGPTAALDSHPNGALVPVEPAEVVEARSSALAALEAGGDGRLANAPIFAAGIDGLIAVGDALVPGNSVSDTEEVAAAKTEFQAAFNMAMAGGAGDK